MIQKNTTTDAAREAGQMNIAEKFPEAIRHAADRGDSREAGQLGQLFGSWKKQRGVGDCMARNAILAEMAKSGLAGGVR